MTQIMRSNVATIQHCNDCFVYCNYADGILQARN